MSTSGAVVECFVATASRTQDNVANASHVRDSSVTFVGMEEYSTAKSVMDYTI